MTETPMDNPVRHMRVAGAQSAGYPVPSHQSLPVQEPGTARCPSELRCTTSP